jgi:DNA-binding NarL/FixJ family response regulator
MTISVSIVEDNRTTCETLAELLNSEPNFQCLDIYTSAESAVRDVPQKIPDVLLVDINLPCMNGIECVRRLKEKLPDLQILMLTAYDESDLIFNSLRAGASGYLLKKKVSTELIPAIEEVWAGGAPMSTQIARKVVAHFHKVGQPTSEVDQLSLREQQILSLLANGALYKEISEKLGITLNTVKAHVRRIYKRLHVQSRMQAAKKLREQ